MRKVFSLGEIRILLPRLIKHTELIIKTMSRGKNILDKVLLPENEQESIEDEMVELYSLWASWVYLQGAQVKGPWQVDFDNGNGYYAWRYGEKDIHFEHSYETAFTERTKIENSISDQHENHSEESGS